MARLNKQDIAKALHQALTVSHDGGAYIGDFDSNGPTVIDGNFDLSEAARLLIIKIDKLNT